MWHSRLTRWFDGKRERILWGVGGTAALAVILLSCSTTTRTILAPPSIPGAEFVGSEQCATCHEEIVRDFRTATHARLQRTKTEIVNKSGGKGSEAKGTTVKQSTDMGCESCHGPGSLHVKAGGGAGTIINPRKDRRKLVSNVTSKCARSSNCLTIIRCSEGKMSCADCHNPHKGIAIKGGGTSLQQTIKGGGFAFLSRNETCFQCHTQQRGPFVFEHEAVREGCVICHSPHGSVNHDCSTNATPRFA